LWQVVILFLLEKNMGKPNVYFCFFCAKLNAKNGDFCKKMTRFWRFAMARHKKIFQNVFNRKKIVGKFAIDR